MSRIHAVRTVVVLFVLFCCDLSVHAEGWPEVFEPTVLRTLHLETINAADWDTIEGDETYDIEVPALFWADGEEATKLYVSVRRKSGDPLPPSNGIGGPKTA